MYSSVSRCHFSRTILAGGPRVGTVSNASASARTFASSSGFDKVGVVGLGLMGHGIAQVAASSGAHSSVIAFEPQQEFLDKGRARIEQSIGKLVKREKLTQQQADEILGKTITFTTDVSMLADADFIVEAVIENIDLKKDLYTSLGSTCKSDTIFASNTSSLSISEMAAFSGRPNLFCGVHFFNPVQIMKLVEVIHTPDTDLAVLEKVKSWVDNDIKKVSVSCGVTPGFIVNRLLVPSLMQAMLMVDRQDASVADIDISLQLGAGHPMGPLHLADYIGLDTCYYIVEGWVKKYSYEPAFVLPECLKQKVDAGDFGRKSGKGFYHWDGDKRGDPVSYITI